MPTSTDKEGAPTVAEFGIDMILRKEMEAREKLQEALYFLEQIKKLEHEGRSRTFSEDEFRKRNLVLRANLSAFILAWHSIPEIMLYDFAEKFNLPFTRNDRMMCYDFALAALNNPNRDDALDLLAWLNKETKELRKKHNRLASMRDIVTHRGIIVTERGEKQVVETVEALNTSGVSTWISGVQGWYPSEQTEAIREEPRMYDVTDGRIRPIAEGRLHVAGTAPPVAEEARAVAVPYAYGVMKPVVLAREEEMIEKTESLTYLTGDPDKIPISDRCESAYNDMKKLVDEAWTRTSASV